MRAPAGYRLRIRAEWTCRCGHVNVVLGGVLRNRRQHTNYGVRPIIHLKDLADDIRIASVMAHPIFIAEHQNGIGILVSSLATKVRPKTGFTPSMSKKLAETTPVCTR